MGINKKVEKLIEHQNDFQKKQLIMTAQLQAQIDVVYMYLLGLSKEIISPETRKGIFNLIWSRMLMYFERMGLDLSEEELNFVKECFEGGSKEYDKFIEFANMEDILGHFKGMGEAKA